MENKIIHPAPGEEWHGRIVARLLGPNVNREYEQQNKPSAKIEPSSMVQGSGPLSFIPTSPRVHEDFESEKARLDTMPMSCINLDVYLFPKNHSQQREPLQLSLQRDTCEDANAALQRMGINISKKLKTKKKGKRDRTDNSSAALELPQVTVDGSVLKTAGMTTKELFTLALGKPVTIIVKANNLFIPLHVECNPPTITRVATFEKFGGKIFPGVPLVIEVETIYATNTIVDWYVDNDVLVCRNSISYAPTLEDANKSLSILITPTRPGHNGQGCEEGYQFQEKVESCIPENTLLEIRPTWLQPRKISSSTPLRVLTYNILADQNQSFWEDGRDQQANNLLNRSRRMPLILHEILAYQADVICLQEVDALIYHSLLQPVLEHVGYQGYYSVKQTHGNQEGCAMFWSLKVFQRASDDECNTFLLGNVLKDLLQTESKEWQDAATAIRQMFQQRPDLEDVVLNKLGHVLQIARLQDKNGNPMLVANVHNFFHPIADHVRTLQLLAACFQLAIEQESGRKPFCFCGDFNTSLANAARLLVERHTPKNFRRHKQHLNTFTWDVALPQEGYDHDFPELRLPDSFPDVLPGYKVQPEFTHYVKGYKGSLDHIMFSSSKTTAGDQIKTLRSGEMPTVEQVTRYDSAMPSPYFPSDHVSLLCDLEWTRAGPNESSKDTS